MEPVKKRKRRSQFSESERKRRRSATNKRLNKTRIVIGEEIDRWKTLRESLELKTDALLAKFLLDSERTLTGVETLPESESDNGKSRIPKLKQLKSGRVSKKRLSKSFLDPFELSIDVTIEPREDEDSDFDYEPQHFFSAVLPEEVNRAAEDITLEEMEFGMEHETDMEEEEEEDEDLPVGKGIVKILTEEECRELPDLQTCLVFLKQIITLADYTRLSCKECGSLSEIHNNFIGSALYLKWVCVKGHVVHSWCSQPVLNRRVHSGDFLTALAVVTSGNNYGKIAKFARMLNLKFLSTSTFHRIQSNYLVKTVDSMWALHQEEVLAGYRDQDQIILGDGRMDSPGHCAQYCTYTVMENSSKKILAIQTLDKRIVERKSANMEKKGFQSCLDELHNRNITIKEVVTDAHLGIGALMKSQYPNIKHSNDVWHAAKNLGKKIIKAGSKKGCGILQKWSKDIINHFWFSCKTANSYPEFMSIWRGVLHHITNQHTWVLAHGEGVNHCLHGPLAEEERDKPWLDKEKDREALSALSTVILDKRFLNRIHYLLNFRSTAEIEVFNQLILMYCAKRYAYSPPVHRMRNLLAALDHNINIDRPLKTNKDGNIVYNRYYNKKSARWSVHPVKITKTYEHVKKLAGNALVMRLEDKLGMKRKIELEATDPRVISKHLAPISPPPTHQLVAEHKSRFEKDSQ